MRRSAPVFVDIKCQLAEEFGAVHGSVVPARPDGYVALHRISLDPTVVSAALAVIRTNFVAAESP
jgi:hypothetical protein